MPTVPSTCVHLDFQSIPEVAALTEANLLSPSERTAGPTPDPDLDDMILIPVDQGNVVSQHSISLPPSQASASTGKPRIDLGSLNLHSPSSIVGTPFDISPRFEYPFPPASRPSPYPPSIYDFDLGVPSFPGLAAHISALPLIPKAVPMPPLAVHPGNARGETRSFSPTHLKLQARDPPVPPSLVKKRKLTKPAPCSEAALASKHPPTRRPRAGSLSDLPEHLRQAHARGRVDSVFDADRDRSHSLDVARKRAPLERVRSDTTVVDPSVGFFDAKPPLLHASSSETLLSDSEPAEKLVESPRSASPVSDASSDSLENSIAPSSTLRSSEPSPQ
ncbi:hypothetical protein VTO73DRAFT_8282 [Trametes versicolor]